VPALPAPVGLRARLGRREVALALAAAALVASGFWLRGELESSSLQARLLAPLARGASFAPAAGAAPDPWFPPGGPYDERLGYARLPEVTARLVAEGYAVDAQARLSPGLRTLTAFGLFPPYREKTSSGLVIVDRGGEPLFAARHPARVYPGFEAIPPVLVQALLYIENRELLDAQHPTRNPAIEWDRFSRAALHRLLRVFYGGLDGAGGSTLATQLEKFRHSPAGVTPSPGEKLRQIASASVRAYREGEDTTRARRDIVVDYLNSIPLAALPGRGEVIGLADGLESWFGADFTEVNRLLGPHHPRDGADGAEDESLAARALALRQALSLLVAVRAPSTYLLRDHEALAGRTDAYLRLLAAEGAITPTLRDAALAIELRPLARAPRTAGAAPADVERVSAVRAGLLPLLGIPDLYTLDRLDLTVESTLDGGVQEHVLALLRELGDREHARASGLISPRLLEHGDPSLVTYGFSLFERTPGLNLLRVQADTLGQPLDVMDGAKLDLGSTAKLRTLATYLDVMAQLHARYSAMTPEERALEVPHASDRISHWALDELGARPAQSLEQFLAAALERRYSASPYERFFTGGGLHSFANFDEAHDERVMSVREAFRHSVNLVFVRLMRDVVAYYMFRVPGSSAKLLADAQDPRRELYLRRFADREGRVFLSRFHRKYRGAGPEEALERLLRGVPSRERRLAVTLRSVAPELELPAFGEALRQRLPHAGLSDDGIRKLYDTYGPDRFDLSDRGYLAGVHPLELWLVAYLRTHPEASLAQVTEASADERIEIYRWLFKTRRKHTQDRRIRTLLEIEAFLEIHRHWKRMGYPFDSLVPSFATAIGSAADRPSALAELVGIVLNDGVRQPTSRVQRLRFAGDTPYETVLSREAEPGERVMAPEVAAALRAAMLDVVEGGTALRARGALVGADGTPLPVGGKTGTGDHRFERFGPGGYLIESRVLGRTATFVFFAGDRFYGVLTAYVNGPDAARYGFTSSLPTQIFKLLGPSLAPLVQGEPTISAAAAASAS
jgi:membrane peptidoglycan carboxypeptidase